ncbi:MAG: hypothetical protein ACRC8D_12900 [Aeromonas sp.]
MQISDKIERDHIRAGVNIFWFYSLKGIANPDFSGKRQSTNHAEKALSLSFTCHIIHQASVFPIKNKNKKYLIIITLHPNQNKIGIFYSNI